VEIKSSAVDTRQMKKTWMMIKLHPGVKAFIAKIRVQFIDDWSACPFSKL
jgi:hypothetical protein